jgi:hypothetical protein
MASETEPVHFCCSHRVLAATALVITVSCFAAGVAISYKQPSLFVFILLGTSSTVVVIRALLTTLPWLARYFSTGPRHPHHTRPIFTSIRPRQPRSSRQRDFSDLVLLMESRALTPEDIEALLRLEQVVAQRSQASIERAIARLPTYPYQPSAAAQSSPASCSVACPDAEGPSTTSEADNADSNAQVLSAAYSTATPAAMGSTSRHHGATTAALPAPSCVVCLEKYAPGESIQLLPCMHSFHENCLTPWLRIKATCPVCKSSLKEMLRRAAGSHTALDVSPALQNETGPS